MFQYNIILQLYQSFKLPRSTLGANRHMRWHFCMKFNSKQHLYEPFFDAMRIFGSSQAPKWIYFSFFLHYNISKMGIFRAPWLHSGGDRHMPSQAFLYKIQFQTFIRTFFWCDAYFWQHSSVNAKIHAFSIDHNVKSSANDRGAIFGMMHAGEPLN